MKGLLNIFLPSVPAGLEITIRDEETMAYEVHNANGFVKSFGRNYFRACWWAFLNAHKARHWQCYLLTGQLPKRK